jgi:GTPase SAR1 family protein
VVALLTAVAGALVSRGLRQDRDAGASIIDETALSDALRNIKQQTEQFSYQRNSPDDTPQTKVPIFETLLNPKLELVQPLGQRIGDRDAQEFWPHTSPREVFDLAEGQLLVVGEPGSGKTVLLGELVRHVVNTRPHLTPILVNLSGWSGHRTFREFLIAQLTYRGTGRSLTAQQAELVLTRQSLALYLDGLDEVGSRFGSEAIDSLRGFMPGWHAPVVVTCRTSDFEALGTSAPLPIAAVVVPLSDETVRAVAASAVRNGNRSWTVIANGESPLLEWMRLPLYLTTAITSGINPEAVETLPNGKPTPALFDQFITTRLSQFIKRETPGYDSEQARRWLSFIAAYMLNKTGPVKGLTESVDSAVFNLSTLTAPCPSKRTRLAVGLAGGAAVGLAVGLFVDPVSGLLLGPGAGVVLGLDRDGRPIWSKFKWPGFRSLALALAKWLCAGLVFGFALWLGTKVAPGRRRVFTAVLILGIPWLVGGLLLELVDRLRQSVVVSGEPSPDFAWWLSMRSWRNHVISVGLFGAIGFALLGGLLGLPDGLLGGLQAVAIFGSFGLVAGLVTGLVTGLREGGWFIILQHGLRHRLASLGLLPGHGGLEAFLVAMAEEAGLLRSVDGGGSLRFTHDLIQRHLAETHGQDGTSDPEAAQMGMARWIRGGRRYTQAGPS